VDPKQAEVAIMISEKADFRLKSVKRDNEGFMLIKETIHQNNKTFLA
jgi:hypothetical protein